MHITGIRNTHAMINERTYAHCDTAHRQLVHAAHIDHGHHARPVHDKNAYAGPAGGTAPISRLTPPVPRTAGPTKPTPTGTLHSISSRGRAVSSRSRDTDN